MSKASKLRQRELRPVSRSGGRCRLGRVAVEPAVDVVVVQLLAPQHPGERLAHHLGLVRGRGRRASARRRTRRPRPVARPITGSNSAAERERPLLRLPLRRRPAAAAAGARPSAPGCDGDLVPEGALGARLRRVHGGRPADHVVVDAVLGVRRRSAPRRRARGVGLVLAEEAPAARPVRAGRRAARVRRGTDARSTAASRRTGLGRAENRLGRVEIPRPGVAEPGGRQHVQGLGVRAGVGHRDRHQQVVGIGLRVVDLDDPVAVLVEDAGVDQLVLGLELVRAGRSPRSGPRYGNAACG